MDSAQIDAEAGPSNINAYEARAVSPAFRKSIRFQPDEETDSETEERRQSRINSVESPRRQSLIGTSGYVSQLLEQYLVPDSKRTEDIKPIRKQTLEERRATIRAVDEDMKNYMKEATYPKSKPSTTDLNIKRLSTVLKASASKEQIKEETMQDEEYEPSPLLDESRPSSEWKPSHILEEEETGDQKQRSWLGTYIIGKDYWTEKEKNGDEKPEAVSFSMDEKRKPWYEMPIRKPSIIDSALQSIKLKSRWKFQLLTDEIDEEYEEKRRKRLLLAAQAREQPPSADTEEWSEEFMQYFEDVARANNFSHRGTHISMTDVDKWLEKTDILDHNEMTLVHTGLFFLACGGSRHRGLSFHEFTQFLYMVSQARRMPVRDIVRRLTACQRNPADYEVKL